jgi:hypothetical protein
MLEYSVTPRDLYHTPSKPARSRKPARRAGPPLGLAAFAALALCCLAIGERGSIVRAWPALGALYGAAGLPILPDGPVVTKLSSSLIAGPGGPVLTIQGEIANPTDSPTSVRGLRVSVQGANGQELYHWTAPAPKSRLSPGETISFTAKLDAPPQGVGRVAVRFARPNDDAWMPPS